MSIYQSETLGEALADLYDVVRPNSAASAHFRAVADAEQPERAAEAEITSLADQLRTVLRDIKEPSERTKHDPMDCLKHVECVAATVRAVLEDHDL